MPDPRKYTVTLKHYPIYKDSTEVIEVWAYDIPDVIAQVKYNREGCVLAKGETPYDSQYEQYHNNGRPTYTRIDHIAPPAPKEESEAS